MVKPKNEETHVRYAAVLTEYLLRKERCSYKD